MALDRLRFSLLSCNSLKRILLTAECISPYCRVHFSLLHSVFKRCCSPHTKPDRDRNWRVLSEKLIAKAKWNRLYWKSFSKSSFLHHFLSTLFIAFLHFLLLLYLFKTTFFQINRNLYNYFTNLELCKAVISKEQTVILQIII